MHVSLHSSPFLSAVCASVVGEVGFLEEWDRAREFNLGYIPFLHLFAFQIAQESFICSFDCYESWIEYILD